MVNIKPDGVPPLNLARHRMARTDAMIHGETRALVAYWQALRAGRLAPYRIEIDPRDMDCQARNLFVIEVMADGAQRFRLAGSAITDAVGFDLRERPPDAIMAAESRDELTATIAGTLAEPGIGYVRLRAAHAPTEMWEMVLLPLRSDGGALNRLIGLVHPLGTHDAGAESRRFVIEKSQIHPVEVTAEAAPGMAEPPALFRGAPAPARLTSIEGGGGPGRPAGSSPRPQLRVIRDD